MSFTPVLLPTPQEAAQVLTPDKFKIMSRYQVRGDRVAIKMDAPKTTTRGGLSIPEVSVERPFTGTVIGVGDECKATKVGQKVWFSKFSGSMIELELEDNTTFDLLLVREEDIMLSM